MISIRDLKHNITEEKVEQDDDKPEATTTETEIKPTIAFVSREPSPNRGSSLPDVKAIGPDSETKSAWLETRNIDTSRQVKLKKLSHMRYQHPDLAEITKFLRDFGMHVVHRTRNARWFAGYGPDPYVYYARQGSPAKFLGGCFEVQSYADLEKVLRVPGIKVLSSPEIMDLSQQSTTDVEDEEEAARAPGGGYMVTIEDPEGFPVNFIFGQDYDGVLEARRQQNQQGQEQDEGKRKEKLVWNDEIDKPRQRAFQRFKAGPAEVYKLGHFGLNVRNFSAQMDWYTRHFNLVPSDILHIPCPDPSNANKTKPVALFAHINLGQTLTDHHTMFLTELMPDSHQDPHVHHSSFEVHDLDTQFLGHQWLANQNYKSVWGVGRHILGSQIFDYWWDTTGFMVEHYTDGDLVNEDTPLGHGPAGHSGLAVWGPEVPKAFLE